MRAFASKSLPYLKRALACVLDFYTAFIVFGYLVGFASGAVTEDGISLTSAGGAIMYALILGYFLISARQGGTPWQRILGTRRRPAAG